MVRMVGPAVESARARSAMAAKSVSRHVPGMTKSEAPVWRSAKPTSRSRYRWMIGFCTAPSRDSAMERTMVSMPVGSCHETTEPSVTPIACRPAATRSALARNSLKVTVSPSAAMSMA